VVALFAPADNAAFAANGKTLAIFLYYYYICYL
jgi:hypothetical protein